MGYFSNMAIDMCDGKDHSYPSPEQQLLWRLDDLKDRLEELIAADCPYRSGYIYTEDDIRYALSEHLDDICKVERAIELTKADLLEKYGINLCEEIEDNNESNSLENAYNVENDYEQMELVELLFMPAMFTQKIAA